MLEPWVEKVLREHNYLYMFSFFFLLTVVLSGVVSFTGGQSIFAVGLVSLAVAYPVITYFRELNREDIHRRYPLKTLFLNHLDEVFTAWTLFVAVGIGFYAATRSGFLSDFTYQEAFVEGLDGMITSSIGVFNTVFMNNLLVGGFTFLISFISFSGLIFILVWNASIVAHYLVSLESFAGLTALIILPHGLLEVAGYVFSGVGGSVLALRVNNWNALSDEGKNEAWKDAGLLVVGAFIFIFLGAVIETL